MRETLMACVLAAACGANAAARPLAATRGLDADYEVKVVAYYDAKADATLFDAEVAGQRTLICRREGRFTE